MGSLWLTLGCPGAPVGRPLGCLWSPWGTCGIPLGFPGNGSPFSGKKCQNHDTVVYFVASRNSEADPADPPDPPDPAETQHPVQNPPWVPHAGGQDDGSLHKLKLSN